jgi:VanZ family protein
MWGPAAVWAAVLFLLSAWPNPVGPLWLRVNDKFVHFVLFAVLGGALGVGRRWSGSTVSHWTVLAVGLLYGASDEWHQALVPNRTPDVQDWLADAAGVVVGYLAVTYLSRSAEPRPGAVSQAD